MSAQITLTQQPDGTWTASVVEGDETMTFIGAMATVVPYVAPVAAPAPSPAPAPAPAPSPAPTGEVTFAATLDGLAISGSVLPGQRVQVGTSPISLMYYSDGAVCVENCYANCPGDAVLTGVTLMAGTVQLFAGDLTIWAFARTAPFWIVQLVAGTVDPTKVPAYVKTSASMAAQLAHAYDPTQTADPNYSKGPMGSELFSLTMDMTGERPDIGIFPGWDACYLSNPTAENAAVVRTMADAAAVWSYHVIDPKTQKMLSLADYPRATFLPAANTAANPINQAGLRASKTPMKIGTDSHFPAVAVLGGLLYGTEYDKEEAEFAALYCTALWQNYGYRMNSGAGPCTFTRGQTRGKAWRIRQCAQAAMLGGANAAMFQTWTQLMLDDMLAVYKARTGIPCDQDQIIYPNGGIGPWQEDYLYSVLAYVYKLGYATAKEIGLLIAPLHEGRMLHPYPELATIYELSVRDPAGAIVADWAAAVTLSATTNTHLAAALQTSAGSAAFNVAYGQPTYLPGDFVGYPYAATGYAGIMRPTIAALQTFGSPNAAACEAVWLAHQRVDFSTDPKYGIEG